MRMIQALAAIKGGVEAAAGLIEELQQRGLIGDAAVARLAAAEAILNGGKGEAALRFAKDALIFFDARQIWESVFRCNLIVSRVSRDSVEREAHALSARNALGQLRSLWPANDLDGYFRTNEIRRLTEGVEL